MRVAKALEQIISGMTLIYNEYKSDNTIKGEVTKDVQFSFGDQKELNKWIAGRGSLSKYPLVWYVLVKKNRPVNTDYVEVSSRIILFTSTKQEYYNQTRSLINYDQILNPLADKIIQAIEESSKIEFSSLSAQDEDLPCFGLESQEFSASNTQSATIDYLDAKILHVDLRVKNNNCI